jgi:hypothetical protein
MDLNDRKLLEMMGSIKVILSFQMKIVSRESIEYEWLNFNPSNISLFKPYLRYITINCLYDKQQMLNNEISHNHYFIRTSLEVDGDDYKLV